VSVVTVTICATKAEPIASLVLQPRSLIVFTKEAYEECLHSIRAVDEEVVGKDAPVLNQKVSRINELCCLEPSVTALASHRAGRWSRGWRGAASKAAGLLDDETH
jgi:hypothetical protein